LATAAAFCISFNSPLTKIRNYGSLFKHEKRRRNPFPLRQLVRHGRRRRRTRLAKAAGDGGSPSRHYPGQAARAGRPKSPPNLISEPSPMKVNEGQSR
jgi:hypothetical protein